MNDLENFVVGYLEEIGSLVEPKSFGVREVLLPDEVAESWNTAVYQQITFDEIDNPAAIRLGYNNPLVEQMVEQARSQPASTRYFINGLRLDKTGLDELARAAWVLPNSRVIIPRRTTVSRCALHLYPV